MKTKSCVSWRLFVVSESAGASTLFALPTFRQGGHQNGFSTYFTFFLYELWSNWLSYFNLSIPVFVRTICAVLSKNFGTVMKIHVGTRCTVTKNYLCVWRRRSLPRSYEWFGTFAHRFQQHHLFCVEHKVLMPL